MRSRGHEKCARETTPLTSGRYIQCVPLMGPRVVFSANSIPSTDGLRIPSQRPEQKLPVPRSSDVADCAQGVTPPQREHIGHDRSPPHDV